MDHRHRAGALTSTLIAICLTGACATAPPAPSGGGNPVVYSQPPTDPGPPAAGAGCAITPATPSLCTIVDLHGATTIHGATRSSATTDTTPLPTTCAQWLHGTRAGDGTPTLQLFNSDPLTVGPTTFGLALTIRPWNGPGDYAPPQLHGATGAAELDITGPDYAGYTPTQDPTTETVTVHPDGSGQLTLTNWPKIGGTTDTLSGTLTWTCHDDTTH